MSQEPGNDANSPSDPAAAEAVNETPAEPIIESSAPSPEAPPVPVPPEIPVPAATPVSSMPTVSADEPQPAAPIAQPTDAPESIAAPTDTADAPETPAPAVADTADAPETPAAAVADTADAPEAPAAPATTADAPETPAAAVADTADAPETPAAPATTADAPETPAAAVADTADAPETPAAAVADTADAPETPAAPAIIADAPAPVIGQVAATPAEAAAAVPIAGTSDPVNLGPPSMGGFESGQIITGPALSVTKNEIEVDLGDGKVGVVGARHWTPNLVVDLTGEANVGDSIEAAVLVRADPKQRIVLSRTWARQKLAWDTVEKADKENSTISAKVVDVVKGGLSLESSGLRAFLPASLVDVEPVADLEPLVGQTFEVRVIEADRTKARLIVSRKAALRAEQRQAAKAALGSIEVGTMAKGKVVQVTDFGAFVEVDGIRGLVHRSELGWKRVRHPSEAVKVGDEVDVKVVRVQQSKNRLGLSMRIGDDPLKGIKVGSRMEGTVTRLVDFGAFVLLNNSIEGLVHVSELAEYRVFQPEEVVMPGETVTIKVLKIDRKRRTLDLSMRQAMVPDLDPPADEPEEEPAPEEPAAEEPATEEPATEDEPATDVVAADESAEDDAEKPSDDSAAAKESE